MAAYAATVAITPTKNPVPLGGFPGVAVLLGTCNITNYNSTRAEITGITGRFKGPVTVVCSGPSSNGHLVAWDAASKAFKSWTPDVDVAGTPQALAETATDVNVGTVHFIAFGMT